ncbi:MAG TPA: DUF2497 domain-containing protein [Hyphomicrobiaceae bacterium]|nr:DUF2497 domain-containing protein [Hyphomicrobiaceae bacterium]
MDLGAIVPQREVATQSPRESVGPAPEPVIRIVDDAAVPLDPLKVQPKAIVAPGLPKLGEPSLEASSTACSAHLDATDATSAAAVAAAAATSAVVSAMRTVPSDPAPITVSAAPIKVPTADDSPPPVAASVAAPPAPAIGAASMVGSADALAPVRTLEDTVSDLLRPMIRQWLDQNMPRMVERALKIEVAGPSDTDAGGSAKR